MGLDLGRRFAEQFVVVDRGVVGQGAGGHLGRHLAVLEHPHHVFLQHPAHHGRLQAPAGETLHQHLLRAGLHHKQHPLLGFAEQKLIGRHAGLAGGHAIEVQLDAQTPLGGHLRAAAGEAGGTHILGGHHIATREGLQAGLNQPFLEERITHLHGGPIIQGGLGELGGRKTGAAHAVAAGGAAHVNHRIAHALGAGADDLLGFHQPQGHGVHQRVAGVAGIEGHLTAHGGHAHAVAVVGDACHHALHQAHVALIFQGPKAQGIEQGNRPGTHGEDVAQDAAHTRGRPLERLHRRGVVVALDLEGQALALAQIHHAGVLARAHQDAGASGGETRKQRPRVAVAAVLRPHHPKHAQLSPVGGPAQAAADLVVIGLAEVLLFQCLGNGIGGSGDHRHLGQIFPVSTRVPGTVALGWSDPGIVISGTAGLGFLLGWLRGANRLLPRGFLQPSFEFLLKTTTHLLHLVTPAPGAPQNVLPHTRPGQGQVVETLDIGPYPAWLLVDQAIQAEPPAAAAGQAGIAAAHEVMANAAGGQLDGGIREGAHRLLPAVEHLGLDQAGQPLDHPLFRFGRLPLHQHFQVDQAAQLVELPHQPAGSKR